MCPARHKTRITSHSQNKSHNTATVCHDDVLFYVAAITYNYDQRQPCIGYSTRLYHNAITSNNASHARQFILYTVGSIYIVLFMYM